MAKQKAKKRHIANSDTDSENSYPVSQPTNSSSSSSSTSTKKPYVPKFLIIHSEKEGETISSLSPFVVHKTILKAKSNFTLLLYIHFLGIGAWYFKCV